MARGPSTLNSSLPQHINENGSVQLRASYGVQWAFPEILVEQAATTAVFSQDLLGLKTKAFTVINNTGGALGAGSLLQASPDGETWENISTGDWDALADGAALSVTNETARRYWRITVVGQAGADGTVGVFVDANIG